MIGKVKDIIEDEGVVVVMVQISKISAARLWPIVGKEVEISWGKL